MISFSQYVNEEVYNVREVAKLLKVKEATIYKLLNNGDIVGYRVGTSWRIPISSVEDYFYRLNGKGDSSAK